MMERFENSDGTLTAEMAECQFCRFYNHGEGRCQRRAPSQLVDHLQGLAEQIMPLLFPDGDVVVLTDPQWVVVAENDWCGEFERGVVLATETIEQQKGRT
jgi:hypothetical protein